MQPENYGKEQMGQEENKKPQQPSTGSTPGQKPAADRDFEREESEDRDEQNV